jgi:uncharacterized protein (DUF952 family)
VTRIYKILKASEWARALASGRFEGSADDRADGFIHFSTAGQIPETARRHFAGQTGLIMLALRAEDLGSALKWEPSRGGALFPHFYGALACDRVIEARAVALAADGVPELSDLVP